MFNNQARLPVVGLGYQPSPEKNPFNLYFVLPASSPGVTVVQSSWEWTTNDWFNLKLMSQEGAQT